MDEQELRALALSHRPEMLRILAGVARDPTASAKNCDSARKRLVRQLEQIGDELSPDLRRELEDAVQGGSPPRGGRT